MSRLNRQEKICARSSIEIICQILVDDEQYELIKVLDVLESLIHKIPDILYRFNFTREMFDMACYYHRLDFILHLVEDKKVNVYSFMGGFLSAITYNDLEMVRFYLDLGCDPLYRRFITRRDPFSYICDDNIQMYKLMYKYSKFNDRYCYNYLRHCETVLIQAIDRRQYNICRYILRKENSLVNITDKDGFTLLMLAAINYDVEMMDILIKHGADVSHIRKIPYDNWPPTKRDIIDLMIRYLFYKRIRDDPKFDQVISILIKAGLQPRCLIRPNSYQNYLNDHDTMTNEYDEIISRIRKIAVSQLTTLLYYEANQSDSSLFNIPNEIIHLIVNKVY